VRAGRDSSVRKGMLINSSRAIIYASKADDFAHAAGEAARATRGSISAVL
jgi:orotidine-5'-phosphate decarboxylase